MKLVQKTYLFCLLLLFILSFSLPAQAQSGLQQLDDRIMIDLQNQRTPEQTGIFMFLSRTHSYGDIGVPVGLLAAGVISNDKQMRQNSLYVASSTLLSTGLTYLIKHIVKRPRPFVQNINIVPVYRAGSTSFPSGHTSSSFATAAASMRPDPKGTKDRGRICPSSGASRVRPARSALR